MATIHDVAKHAGVASITVSRVINNSGYVSRETRERVEGAIVELKYVPNTLARGLRSKRTNTLALVMTDITNPFF
ncbi:MAG: LacI family DNA-binding transcriptional regulator, partial [Anaerolineales bacterium]